MLGTTNIKYVQDIFLQKYIKGNAKTRLSEGMEIL